MKIQPLATDSLRLSTEDRAHEILKTLRANLTIRSQDFAAVQVAEESHDPFRVLIITILSQNCTDKSSLRAYRRLDQRVGVTPSRLSHANIRTIEAAVRVAGLFRQKSRAIKQLSKACDSKELDLESIVSGQVEEARRRLQEFPKVGPKTADVLLSVWDKPTISVDTHVDRVSKRLGLAPPKGKYEEVRGALMAAFDESDYVTVPLLFMAHGRRFCRALSPLCSVCPVRSLCPYPKKFRAAVKAPRLSRPAQ
jgi:endonuclease-3